MWFGMTTKLNPLHVNDKRITISSTFIEPSSVVRNLGVYFDAEPSMRDHVTRTAKTHFCHLQPLRSVCRLVRQDVTVQLMSALVPTGID
jgi:hypothetical protein